jgi:hypothetical protein
MNHLISYKLFESKSELIEFVDYLNHDLEDDGFTIRKSDTFQFMRDKWKNIRYNDSIFKSRKDEFNLYKGKEIEVFEIVTNSLAIANAFPNKKKGILFSTNLNLYDAEPHVKRLLDYAKGLGYNHFEVRKITQMSRKSQDVTQSFTGKGRLPESAKREILILQILIMKNI